MIAGLLLAAAVCAVPGQAAGPEVVDRLVRADTGTGEPQVALLPGSSSTVVVGQNNDGVAVSRDAGRTWRQVALPNQGDNTTTVDAAGVFAYTSLDGTVHTSRDRGVTWEPVGNWVGSLAALWSEVGVDGVPFRFLGCNAPLPAGPVDPVRGPGLHLIACDRPWLTADASVPGRLHVSFVDHSSRSGNGLLQDPLGSAVCKTSTATNPLTACGRQHVTTSVDGGRTWSPFVPVDAREAPQDHTNGFSGIPVARDGLLATSYLASAFPGSSCTTCVVFQTSVDEGRSWQRRLVPARLDGPALGADDPNPLAVSSSLAFMPYLAQDPSRAGRYAVMLLDPQQRVLEVHVTTDFGRTWARPARLTQPGGAQLWVPWVAYGPGGALGVMWRGTAPDGSYTVWAAVSPAGSTRFARPVRLSSAVSPGPVTQVAGDDNSHVALDRTTLHAVWGDRRDGPLGLRYGRYTFATDPAVQRLR